VAVVIAGLAGWLLAGMSGAAGPQQVAGPPTASTATSAPAAGLVTVNGGLLAGQPVNAVLQQLRQLGLQPRVEWVAAARQIPGTVVSVQPSGQVPAGATVVVTAATRPHGHGHGQGNQDGKSGD
jgi:eukaryotic-like serine/threonine-protein kinase